MSAPQTPRYADHPSWTRYRDLLGERFGVTFVRTPTERHTPWRDCLLHIDDWAPEGSPKGVAIFVHGAGGHGRLLAPYADHLAGLGWRAIAPDLPGYGLTLTPRHWRADYADWPAIIADLAREHAAAGPVVLIGLSVGGLTALRAAQREPAVRGVIATTLIDLADAPTFVHAARWPWLGALSLATARIAPFLLDAMVLPLGLVTPLKNLTSDKALARALETDALIGRRLVPGRFFRTLHMYRPRPDYDLACPLMLVHPGADAWTPTAMSMPVFDAVTSPKRFRELSNGAHLPLEEPAMSELKNETEQFLSTISI
jgi:alpha-beta hydrolase superfamily lysophospholipase